MIQKHFEDIIRKKFGYDFSPTQQIAVEHFIRFFFAREEEGIFLLKGYAGTGKTSLVAAIVNALVRRVLSDSLLEFLIFLVEFFLSSL